MFVVFDSQKRKASFFCSEECMKNFDSEAIIRQTWKMTKDLGRQRTGMADSSYSLIDIVHIYVAGPYTG